MKAAARCALAMVLGTFLMTCCFGVVRDEPTHRMFVYRDEFPRGYRIKNIDASDTTSEPYIQIMLCKLHALPPIIWNRLGCIKEISFFFFNGRLFQKFVATRHVIKVRRVLGNNCSIAVETCQISDMGQRPCRRQQHELGLPIRPAGQSSGAMRIDVDVDGRWTSSALQFEIGRESQFRRRRRKNLGLAL